MQCARKVRVSPSIVLSAAGARPRIHLQPLLLLIRRTAAVISPDPGGEQPYSATVPVYRASESSPLDLRSLLPTFLLINLP